MLAAPLARPRDRVLWGLAIAAMPVGCATLYVADPATSDIYPSCPFRSITGLWCPGCGTGRALHQLLRGHPLRALSLNPLAVVLVPLAVGLAVSAAFVVARGRGLPRPSIRPFVGWSALAAVVAFSVLRNVPAFEFLAP